MAVQVQQDGAISTADLGKLSSPREELAVRVELPNSLPMNVKSAIYSLLFIAETENLPMALKIRGNDILIDYSTLDGDSLGRKTSVFSAFRDLAVKNGYSVLRLDNSPDFGEAIIASGLRNLLFGRPGRGPDTIQNQAA